MQHVLQRLYLIRKQSEEDKVDWDHESLRSEPRQYSNKQCVLFKLSEARGRKLVLLVWLTGQISIIQALLLIHLSFIQK